MKIWFSQYRLRLMQAVLLCAGLCALSACSSAILDRALEADYDQNFDEAIALYTQAIAADSSSYDAWNNRGYVYLRLGRFDSAVADFSRAVALAPEQRIAWYNRALAWQPLGRYDSTAADYTQLLNLSPLDMNLQMMRARTYTAAGDYMAAISDYDIVLSFDRYFYRAYSERGLAWMHAHRYQRALDDCSEAVRIAHDLLLDVQEQGFNRYWNPQPPPNAVQDTEFERTVEATSFYPPELAQRGKKPIDSTRYRKALGKRRASLAGHAVATYRRILSSMYVNRGMVYSDTGLYDKALDDYRNALSWDSTNAAAYGNIGWAYYLKGDFQACVDFSELALRYDATALYARYNRAIAFLRQGNREQADAAYRDAQEYAGFLLDPANYTDMTPGTASIAGTTVLVNNAREGAVSDLRELVRQGILTAEATRILQSVFSTDPR